MRTRSLPAYLLVAVAALAPRAIDLGRFVTIDEITSWMLRSQRFLGALGSGDLAATAQSAHPGVTTMWLGAGGILLHGLAAARGLVDPADFTARLALMQLPVALVNAAAVMAGLWLLRRLLPAPLALLAAMLWALDPFVIGFSRVLHVDGLLASFATLSLLCACVYWGGAGEPDERRSPALLAASGALAALAMLSKSPGVALAPAAAGIGLLATRRERRPWRQLLRELLIWGGCAALAALLIWPALWAAPQIALARLLEGVTVEGGEPHQSGNYFLGAPTAVPGPLIYPLALALRLTPWTLAGLGLLGLLWGRLGRGERAALGGLALFALGFVAELSLFPKQFDRYLVPIFPALDILAAAGLWALVHRDATKSLAGSTHRAAGSRRHLATKAAFAASARLAWQGGLLLAAAINVGWWHPYELIAYNQLLGGAPAGEWALRMGWGEGLQDVAAWLNRQPDSAEVVTLSTAVSSLRPYLRPGVAAELPRGDGRLPDKAGYVVIYLRSRQDGQLDPPFDAIAAAEQPVYTLRIEGVTYAQIYEVVPTPQHALRAYFGDSIALRGYDLAETGDSLQLTLYWETLHPPAAASLFVHLIGADGQRAAQADLPALSAAWEGGRHYRTRLALPLPGQRRQSPYRLAIGMYDPQRLTRLALTGGAPVDPAVDGDNALLLATLAQASP